jgi:SAM-dependent methyltransferase
MDATNLKFNEEFDAVFSNLLIHHIKPPKHKQVISSVWKALRPGGRFVAEFYGHGTAKEIILALQEVMRFHNYSFDINEDFPWYLPTQEEYCNLLINQGFEGTAHSFFPPRKLDLLHENIVDWLHKVIKTNTQNFDDNIKEQIFPKVQDQVLCQLFKDRQWFVNYQHIRIVAIKSE